MRRSITAIVFAIVIIFIILFSYWGNVISLFIPDPLNHLVKVSNRDFAGNSTEIYFISWYGCPYGATLSWPLYVMLRHYGNVSVQPHYSIFESDIGEPVPGLIFTNFSSNSSIHFHYLYLYNQYLNATPNGTKITNLVQYGLNVIKNKTPEWVYSLVEKYEVNEPLAGFMLSVVNSGNPPHIATVLIITDPKGTWMLIGYPSSLTPGQILSISTNSTSLLKDINSGNVPSSIYSYYEKLEETLD